MGGEHPWHHSGGWLEGGCWQLVWSLPAAGEMGRGGTCEVGTQPASIPVLGIGTLN